MHDAGRYDNSFLSIFPVGDTTRYVPDDQVCATAASGGMQSCSHGLLANTLQHVAPRWVALLLSFAFFVAILPVILCSPYVQDPYKTCCIPP